MRHTLSTRRRRPPLHARRRGRRRRRRHGRVRRDGRRRGGRDRVPGGGRAPGSWDRDDPPRIPGATRCGPWDPPLSRRLPPPERADARSVRGAGFEVRWEHGDASLGGADFELVPSEGWLDAHAQRDDVAQARSIARLLSLRAIAVVGAGRREGSIGRAIVDNLLLGDFTGTVHPVNPHAATIAGQTTYRSVLEIPGPVDLAVIAVPAAEVLEVVRQCAEKHARTGRDLGRIRRAGGERRPGGARC